MHGRQLIKLKGGDDVYSSMMDEAKVVAGGCNYPEMVNKMVFNSNGGDNLCTNEHLHAIKPPNSWKR